MPDAPASAGLPAPPDPTPDQAGQPMPEGIALFLAILHVLLKYGRHLNETIERRATYRGFATIARCFGTARITVILAHLARGIRRAIALERVLLARAATGRDIPFAKERKRSPQQPPPADAAPKPATLAVLREPRRTDPAEPPDIWHLPSVEEFEAQIRRRPLARALADVCRDFGVAAGLCTRGLWNAVFFSLNDYGGRASLASFGRDMYEREKRFLKDEADRNPALGWPERTREATRRVLGFFIGEEPVDPYAGLITATVPAAALGGTGPP